MNKIRSSSDERFNLEQQCLDFLETQGVEVFEHPGMDRLDSLVLQCLSLSDPSALDQDMTEGLAALRAKRDAASGVTGEWTRVEERREAR